MKYIDSPIIINALKKTYRHKGVNLMKIGKVGRNDPCPCGSGLKYKKCCFGKKVWISPKDVKIKYLQKYGIRLKSEKDIDGIRKTGELAIKTLTLVENIIRPGLKTDEINTLVHDFTTSKGAVCAPLNYRGFPKSVCVSINEEICHGFPGDRILHDGDIVNVDVTPIMNGYYADMSKTFFVGTPGQNAKKIVKITRECLKAGLKEVKPGNTVGDIGWAIQKCAESWKTSVVREFVGHGVGFDFHEPPQIPHYGKRKEGITLVPGMVFTIEPMINLGKKELYLLDNNWTAVTADKKLSAQFEQTIRVTETGHESLTPYDL